MKMAASIRSMGETTTPFLKPMKSSCASKNNLPNPKFDSIEGHALTGNFCNNVASVNLELENPLVGTKNDKIELERRDSVAQLSQTRSVTADKSEIVHVNENNKPKKLYYVLYIK